MTTTASASSSSATSRPELPAPLPELVESWCRGLHRELLSPVRFRGMGEERELPAPEVDRSRIAEALGRANDGYGHPRSHLLAEKLSEPETRVVVAGQQAGLFGGPLYTLLKALGATLEAERLERRGAPAVALFWVATEDHDFDEVAGTGFWAGQERIEVGLGEDPDPLLPVGMRTLGPGVEEVFRKLEERFDYSPFREWIQTLRAHYRPDARFGEAFCRTMTALLGDRSPLWVDALLPELKRAQDPFLRRLIEERRGVEERLAERDRTIEEAGFSLQVPHPADAAPLFLLSGGERRRIVWVGQERFALRGGDREPRPVNELLETLDDNPSVLSTNVLTRPAVQDAVFGTSLQLLGPGELSYFAQAAPFYDLLGIPAPVVTLRPQALLVEERHWKILDELSLPPSAVLEPEESLDRRLARRLAPDFMEPSKERAEELLDDLRDRALVLDPNLERPWEKTRENVLRALETFGSKVRQAAARRDEVVHRRLENLRSFVAPGGEPHERNLSVSYFRGRYGEGLIDRLAGGLESRPGRLQVIDPAEGTE
ncbi:MAG: bacillithiol biosynthesis cysteine-adding enzyme BshC [Thermoanaerobaculia bacterium]|nr:bacillithiol biosynthesis cysteine-adding enzyme BshC [Thermoanaerobaculia bacterium]